MEHIDAVIAWVEGNDPKHLKKRDYYYQFEKIDGLERIGATDTRFNQVDEVKFCIYSIRKYASWINDIYIVTDDQQPKWLSEDLMSELGIKIIDHTHIFRGYEELLPTFNSRSIESVLWRINGLSNKYIYLNDDFFLINYVKPDDFFFEGKIKYRGVWKRNWKGLLYNVYKKLATLTVDRNFERGSSIKKAALMAGFNKYYYYLSHSPYAMIRDEQETYYQKHDNILKKNISYKFRNTNQYVAPSLFAHLSFKQGLGVDLGVDDIEYISCINHSYSEISTKLNNLDINNKKFLCVQNMDKADPKSKVLIKCYLKNRCIK